MNKYNPEEIDDDREFWPSLEEMKLELASLQKIFDYNGGRGIELADEIDVLQARIDVLSGEENV